MKNFFVKGKSKSVKKNVAVNPFVLIAMIAAITLVVFIISFFAIRFL